jgi:hypothetical protein
LVFTQSFASLAFHIKECLKISLKRTPGKQKPLGLRPVDHGSDMVAL